MENEKEINILDNNNQISSKSIFKLDYLEQNLDNNAEFHNWQSENIAFLGKKAKLFKCIKDKIYFYTSYQKIKKYPFYISNCPLCNIPICYFCSRYSKNDYPDCCLPMRLYCMFRQDGFQFIDPIGNQHREYNRYKEILILFCIPVLNFLYFCAFIFSSLFYKLSVKNCEFKEDGYLKKYEAKLKEQRYFDLIIIINGAMCIILAISFSLIFNFFILLLLIISIPFKQYPMKYFCGVLFGKF